MLLVDELYVVVLCLVEDYAHDCLAGTDWAIYLGVDLVDWDWVPLAHEGVKDILAELLPLYYHFLWLWVDVSVEHCQCVYTVCFLGHSWGYWTRIQPIETCSPDYWYLWTSRNQHLDAVLVELAQNLRFEERWLTESTYHENEIHLFILFLNLTNQLLHFCLDILKQCLEKGNHHGPWQLNISSSLDLQMVLWLVIFIKILNHNLKFLGVQMLWQVR